MKVWTNNQFCGEWPVGTAAVVVADTAEEAAQALRAHLAPADLGDDVTAAQFKRLPTTKPLVVVLRDGSY